jgi:hypothetical protein
MDAVLPCYKPLEQPAYEGSISLSFVTSDIDLPDVTLADFHGSQAFRGIMTSCHYYELKQPVDAI